MGEEEEVRNGDGPFRTGAETLSRLHRSPSAPSSLDHAPCTQRKPVCDITAASSRYVSAGPRTSRTSPRSTFASYRSVQISDTYGSVLLLKRHQPAFSPLCGALRFESDSSPTRESLSEASRVKQASSPSLSPRRGRKRAPPSGSISGLG
ncbi:hypothetical protein AAFF_G00341470 [Aldrovandia affinis]|uniref:Uncharacterized protein n=1 Tax=Aldrovandia affinis TaxID=143900 RepID=A0AAD7SKN1_9TELE|nr:hypothetical protein AAFF_G00341470 [Aldrovandia affinis]